MQCLTQIEIKNIRKMHYIGDDILATKDKSGFKLWHVGTGYMIKSFDMKHRDYLFLPDHKMAIIVDGPEEYCVKIIE